MSAAPDVPDRTSTGSPKGHSTTPEEGHVLPQVRWVSVVVGAVLAAQIVLGVLALWAPPDLYDQGMYLATARFAADGLVPYRDFLYPYGPGLAYLDAIVIWAHGDFLLLHRLLWGLIRFVVSVQLLVLAARRGSLGTGAAVVGLLLLAPVPANYVVPLALTLGALLWVDRRPGVTVVPALLLAVATWFRWEYVAVLALFAAVAVLTASRRRSRLSVGTVYLSAVAVAALPYLVLAALGAGPGMVDVVRYSLGPFARYRGLPYPLTAGPDLFKDLVHARPAGFARHLVQACAYLLGPLLVLGLVVRAVRARGWRGVVTSPSLVLGVVLAAVAMYSLRVRSDLFHSAPLLVALGAAVLVSTRSVWWVVDRVVALSAVLVLVLAVITSTDEIVPPGTGVPGVPRLAGIRLTDSSGLASVLSEAHELDMDGRPLFVADRDNSLTYVNAAFLYWALAARPASPVFEFDPGYADQDDVQAAIVRELCRTRPPVVQWDAPSGDELGDVHFSQRLNRFLMSSYRPIHAEGRFTLLVPASTTSC